MTAVWINGAVIPNGDKAVSVNDSGFTNGIGVFDTMLAIDDTLHHAEEHFARLRRHADIVMGAHAPAYDFAAIAEDLLKRNNLATGRARVRTCITGGVIPTPLAAVSAPSVLMTVAPAPENTVPVDAWIVADYPRIAGNILENCKRIDYSRAYAARRAAEKRGANEALITNTDGMVVCAATSNLFIVEGGQWFTPPLSDGIIDGITRRHVMMENDATEESMLPERVLKADAVYICNSITGLRPLSSLNGKLF